MPVESELNFLDKVIEILKNQITHSTKSFNPDQQVLHYATPTDIRKRLNLDLERCSSDQLLDQISKIIKLSVNTSLPLFCNQLFGGMDQVAVLGDFLTTVLNTSMYTFEVAPVFTEMEIKVIEKLNEFIGWDQCFGQFNPGGSVSNLYAILLAKHTLLPQSKTQGLIQAAFQLKCNGFVILTSQHGHYSMTKMAITAGLGIESVIKVKAEMNGEMDLIDLQKCILEAKEKNLVPLLINATAGTTVFGGFDNIKEISKIAKDNGIWLHVDACVGGSLLFSDKFRKYFDGLRDADSLSWNFHKMLPIPLQCCAFLTKHGNALDSHSNLKTEYLFQPDKLNADRDLGDKSIQCGRNVDVLKLWLFWKSVGTEGIAEHVEKLIENRNYFAQSSDLVFINPNGKMHTICFWYVPQSMQSSTYSKLRKAKTFDQFIQVFESDIDFTRKLNRVAPFIKEEMQKEGKMLIGFQTVGKFPNFFRMVVSSKHCSRDAIDFCIKKIVEYGERFRE